MARKNILSDSEKMLVDAVLFDKSNLDAAYTMKSHSTTERPDILHKMALRWWRSEIVVAYRKTRSTSLSAAGGEERSKADIISELNRLISLETDNKRRGDLLMKLSDLLRENPEENHTENHVQYYLPLKCNACYLWQHFDKAQTIKDPQKRKTIDVAFYENYVDEMWRKAHPNYGKG